MQQLNDNDDAECRISPTVQKGETKKVELCIPPFSEQGRQDRATLFLPFAKECSKVGHLSLDSSSLTQLSNKTHTISIALNAALSTFASCCSLYCTTTSSRTYAVHAYCAAVAQNSYRTYVPSTGSRRIDFAWPVSTLYAMIRVYSYSTTVKP